MHFASWDQNGTQTHIQCYIRDDVFDCEPSMSTPPFSSVCKILRLNKQKYRQTPKWTAEMDRWLVEICSFHSISFSKDPFGKKEKNKITYRYSRAYRLREHTFFG